MSEKIEGLAELLSEIPVFRKFNNQDRAMLIQGSLCKGYEKGEYVVHAGDNFPYAIVVLTGVIRGIKMSPEGRFLEAIKIQKGSGFWNPSLFDDQPISGSIEVWEHSKICLWHQDLILPVLQKNPEAMWELTLEQVKYLRQKSELVEGFAFSSIERRLAGFLLDQFEGGAETSISRSLSLEEMGATIGTTPIMVCRHLSRFTEKGLIAVSRSEFELSDKTGLEKIAETH